MTLHSLRKQPPLFAPGACFSKDPDTFRARKAIFSSSVSKKGEVYTPETSCMKRTSLQNKNAWTKQLCNREVQDFAMALRARKVSGAFEKRAPGPSGVSREGRLRFTSENSILMT